jgi:hypothetical protein
LSTALVGSGPERPIFKDSGVAKMTWWSRHSGGLFREACDAQGQELYTPLYILKEVHRPGSIRRTPPPERIGDDLYVFLYHCPVINSLATIFSNLLLISYSQMGPR